MQDPREEDIRRRAYELWEAEGRPDGQPEDYWFRAERELGAGAAGDGAAEPPQAGLASSLQPGGVAPATGGMEGSIGSGGGSTASAPTGTSRRARSK